MCMVKHTYRNPSIKPFLTRRRIVLIYHAATSTVSLCETMALRDPHALVAWVNEFPGLPRGTPLTRPAHERAGWGVGGGAVLAEELIHQWHKAAGVLQTGHGRLCVMAWEGNG